MENGLILLGLVILVGVVGNLIFTRTRIPESVFLILAGLLIGPVLGLVDRAFFLDNLGLFVTLALIIVMLDAGLNLDIYRTVKNAGYAVAFTVAVFVCTIAAVTFVTRYFFGWPILHGIFLGIVGSGTTTVTISHLVDRLREGVPAIDADSKNLLIIESVVNDLTVITGGSVLLAILEPARSSGQAIATLLFNSLFVSIAVGLIAGLAWVFLYMYKLHGNKLTYLFTLGIALVAFELAEFLGFSGAITVITFGIVIGNHEAIVEKLRVRAKLFEHVEKDVGTMKKTDVEFTFLIRAFFFVLLGIIFDLSVLSDRTILLLAGGVLVAELLARYVGCLIMTPLHASFRTARFIRTTMVASGVTSTLVAFLAIQAGIDIPHFAEIVLLLVLFTTLTAITGAWIQEHRALKAMATKGQARH